MLKPIVVGLDGSRQSLAAAEWGARAALRRGLPLRLVHAWQGSPGEAMPPDLTVPQYWARRVLRGALERISERYPQVYVSAEQVRHPPRQALLTAAEDAELLVLGNEGLSGVGSLFSGSVALSVVSHAPLPVVLVRAGFTAPDEHRPHDSGASCERTPFRDVVAALEPEKSYDELLAFAFAEAALRAATLHAVHVWHLPYSTAHTAVPGVRAASRQAAETAMADRLSPWREKYPTVPVRSSVIRARTAHEIVHVSEGAGLLVVGRGPRHAGMGPRTGPVTHAVIHHVACPVAVAPHG
ncbi:universal stress protein [Streptomyces sp. Q6]|uniref:Universal stress protein n=1 Tax=Streptomyces citrinus TaxID=3118173 RepID=A0ACD5AM65_9ACTN